ncbi:fibronectin type III domain-containing protein 1 [Aulostomus maculatus]
MALAASRTLLALFVTFCAPGRGLTAEKPLRPHNGKHPAMDKGLRETWEPSIHLDGRPVDRFVLSTNKPMRTHRYTKVGKDSRSPLLEDVDPEWVNLDGFAVLGGAPVSNSSAGPARSTVTATRNQPSVKRATRVDRTANPVRASTTRTHRRAPQSSSGPRQPEGALRKTPLLDRRRQHHTKPQSDQRNRHSPKLTSESVHVVSLQAQKALGQSAYANRAATTKTTTPEPPEYEARDISVRVMSPQSVLISWVDPAVEMGKAAPSASRFYTVRFREKGESARWEYKESTQRRMMIDTLAADSMYEFSVRISQGQNEGKWSVSVFQRTPESAPSGPPENFEVKPLRGKGTAVVATWDPPEESNGRIREYILSYAPAMKPFGMKSVTYRGTTTSANIDGLTPGDRYIFKIRATNRRGQGPQSKAFSVVMPGSRSSVSSFSQTKDTPKTSHSPSKQDTDPDDAEILSTEEPEEPTTPTQPRPVNRRVRPLSQTRSYHSIFSSVRGSVRNGANRGSSRGRSDDEDEEEVEMPATAPPVKETTTEDVQETKEPNNDVSPESEDDMGYSNKDEFSTPETPNLKIITPSPTKAASVHPQNRRPFKVKIHQRQGSNAASSSTSAPSTTSSSSSSEPNKDTASLQSKNAYSITHTKPNTPVVEETNAKPQTEDTSVGRGSTSAGRNHGSGLGSRYGYGRRYPGIQSRGNFTRMLNGYKPGVTSALTSRSNLPSRTVNQGTSHTVSATSQSTLPEKSQTSNTFNSATSRSASGGNDNAASNTNSLDKSEPSSNLDKTKVEEPTSTYKEQPTQEEGREESSSEKPAVPRTRINPFQNPGRSGTRVSSSRQGGRIPWSRASSSVGAGRPILRGTPTRVSGATGAAGVSSIQETSEGLRTMSTHDLLKNEEGSLKPSLTSGKEENSDTKNPTTSSSDSDSHHSSTGHRDSSEPIHEGYHNEEKRGNENVAETILPQKNPLTTSTVSHESTEDNESVDTRETPSRPRTGSSSGVPPTQRRPSVGVNGRIRSPLLANRQFGGSRLPIRIQQAQNSRLGSSMPESSLSASSRLPQSVLTSEDDTSSVSIPTRTGGLIDGNSRSASTSSSSSRDGSRAQGRFRSPVLRGKPPNGGGTKPANGNGKNGRPNLTATNDKETSPDGTSKANGQKFITGPDGTKWVLDLELGLLMNQEGQVLQDSQGKPKRVVLGADGRTIFDHMGSPLVNEEGIALFGHGRDSRPVINPKDKVLLIGGKPILGLDLPHQRTTTTTTTTSTTTTTVAPTTTPEPTTTEWIIEESTTVPPYPTCPPGTFAKRDEYGYPVLDSDGILNCYPEDEYFDLTTSPPTTTTTTEIPTSEVDIRPHNRGPKSEFDLSGKRRFTAPYVNYIQKDPGSPCSLTEALEYLQVDILEDLIEKDSLTSNQNQPPKHKVHNLTVVAMEGCHSFIILDWGRPLKDDMVSGYMVHSASYDDVLNNRWSSRASSGTHLAVENLKPNSRYYFKVQAKNVFGLGPVSDTLTYVTESDDPLLIERPPGGEPIWIPFSFKYNSAHSTCKGSQFVKRTWYRKFVGVVLCNSLRYKIFMGDGLREPFYSIGDTFGQGEDHCQFVDSYRDGRTGPAYLSNHLPSAQGFYRAYRQEPVTFGVIGRRTAHPFVGWYECGVPIPGKW